MSSATDIEDTKENRSGEPLPNNWEALYARRLDWASNARKEFINDLSSDEVSRVVGNVEDDNYSTIALAGPTQVGKTALALRLLGVREPAERERVEKVLRGNQKAGQSATATATAFSLAPDDHFRIRTPHEPGSEPLSDVEARRMIGEVRQKVTQGMMPSDETVRIEVPKDAVTVSGNENLDLVDLPGWEGDDAREQRHVRPLVRNYLRHAHLVLIVERADHFSRLQEETLLGVNPYWMHLSDRFGVVLTFSVSSGIQGALKQEDTSIRTTEDFVEHFKGELKRSWRDPESASALSELSLYPLEFSESWELLDTSIREMAAPWIDEVIERLLSRVENIDSTGATLQRLVRRYKDAEQIRNRIKDSASRYREDAKAKIESFEDVIKNGVRRARKAKECLTNRKRMLRSMPAKEDLLPDNVGHLKHYASDRKATREKLLRFLSKRADVTTKKAKNLEGKIDAWAKRLGMDYEAKATFRINEAISSTTRYVSESIRDKLVNWTLPWSDKWHKKVNGSIRRLSSKEKKILHSEAERFVCKANRFLQSRIQRFSSDLRSKLIRLADDWQKRRDMQQNLNATQARFNEKIRRVERDLEEWEALEERFDQAYRREMSFIRDRLRSASHDQRRIALLAYMRVVRDEYKALLSS